MRTGMQDKRAHGAQGTPGASGVAKSAPSTASEGPNPAKGTKGDLRGCWPIDGAAAALEREEVRRAVREGVCSGVRTDAVRSAAGREAESNTKEERAAPGDGATRVRMAQAATHWTGIPSLRALSTRLSVMPEPGNAITPLGSRSNSSSFLRKGAALPWASQSGLHTIW